VASLDDVVTVQKNGVIAINNLSQATLREQGTLTSATVTAATLVFQGKGRLVNFSVVVAGSASGGVYNSTSTSPTSAQQLCAVPTTIGIYPVGQIFTSGLVVVPGTGQSINVTYSTEV